MQQNEARISVVVAASVATATALYLFFKRRPSSRIEEDKKSGSACIYLDYNGTTPIYPEVYEAMMPYFINHFGNPGSTHCLGDKPRKAVENARHTILETLFHKKTALPNSVLFCACGTEADNMAIHLALQHSKKSKPHIVTTNVEHPAVTKCLEYYETKGICSVTYVPVETDGCVATYNVMAAVKSNT